MALSLGHPHPGPLPSRERERNIHRFDIDQPIIGRTLNALWIPLF